MIFEWRYNGTTKEWGISWNTTWMTHIQFIEYIEKEYMRRQKLVHEN